jgi:hypothetical protein
VSLVAKGSGLFLRTVCDLRRVHSHIATMAYPVLNRTSRAASAAYAGHNGTEDGMEDGTEG